MIYTTGTVNTVSGSAIVRGTGTKFKNNNPAINIGMTILIKSGNTNIPYMIKSVNSDTELVLAQPALATATNTTFSIHITEPDNNSDAARTMVAINAYTQYFLDAMNTWMTQTGQTKIEMPNGEVITLDSIKKMQSDISKKLSPGDFGVGTNARGKVRPTEFVQDANLVEDSGFTQPDGGRASNFFDYYAPMLTMVRYGGNDGTGRVTQFQCARNKVAFRTRDSMNWSDWLELYGTSNTTTDPQGFIKKASPVININPDGSFTTNDESEGAIVTRIAKGEYLIEGVLGFNADAGWGGVDGGIEIPLDVNKQPLIWVNSKVNKDGSIFVKTYHRTHSNAPKFARNDIDGFNDGDPIDIPDGRFISVRVQMPEQSIYNVRMREMEEAQKAEEERRQKEDVMKEQFGLGENDVLL
ncbi:hypothetical protein GY03_07380 [Proteus vulgaris]|uniref:phage tail fiber protein n=1 Tax=Proteus vulgaris TaxID=585 RepID=UPI0021B10E0E|nr:hypothetical protein [Proteus vulgaris]MCT6517094.1 hypothetical protein [Proteus vulgaris]